MGGRIGRFSFRTQNLRGKQRREESACPTPYRFSRKWPILSFFVRM